MWACGVVVWCGWLALLFGSGLPPVIVSSTFGFLVYTFLFWLPNYISSTSGLDARSSATLSAFFDVGGIIGGIIAGMVSDSSGMSASTCAIMLILAIPVMFLYQVSTE